MNKNSDFLDQLHKTGGQMTVNISHEMRIRKLESQVRWLSVWLCVLGTALILTANSLH